MDGNNKLVDYPAAKDRNEDIYNSLWWLIIIFSLGLFLSYAINMNGLNKPGSYSGNYFPYLYVRNETIIFVLLIISLVYFRWYLASSTKLSWAANAGERLSHLRSRWIWILALAVLVFAWLGDFGVMHGFPPSADEYAPRFQAQIFLAGKFNVVLDSVWREFAEALAPTFIIFDSQASTWISGYLPVYAGIRTVFLALGGESLTGPVLAALSVLLIYGVAKKIWPRDGFAPILAVVLLGSSTQFLITSMTSFAYPAHLCLNLAWLACYLRDDKLGVAITPWIGFFALGLHNPFPHALFVTPWLLGLVRKRRWKVTLYFAAVYLAGCIVWYLWMRFTRPSMVSGADLHSFELPGFFQLLIQPMNLSLLFSWQSLAASILFIAAVRNWAALSPLDKQLLWGCILTFGFFFFFPWDQFIGWGYRFFYGVLGNFVLIAVAGWNRARQALGEKKCLGFLALTTILAIGVQLPFRCCQVESFVRPLAVANRFIQALPEPMVIIDTHKNFLSASLVRNDPFLRNTPKILRALFLTEEQKQHLQKLGQVRTLKPEELAACGLVIISPKLENQP